eukprot:1144711-Pelagomonas_calceolata.AAC.5
MEVWPCNDCLLAILDRNPRQSSEKCLNAPFRGRGTHFIAIRVSHVKDLASSELDNVCRHRFYVLTRELAAHEATGNKMNMLKQLFSRLLQVPSSTKEEMAKITITITALLGHLQAVPKGVILQTKTWLEWSSIFIVIAPGIFWTSNERITLLAQGDLQSDCSADQPVAGPCQPTANFKAQTEWKL